MRMTRMKMIRMVEASMRAARKEKTLGKNGGCNSLRDTLEEEASRKKRKRGIIK
jgi:hypothetical protein